MPVIDFRYHPKQYPSPSHCVLQNFHGLESPRSYRGDHSEHRLFFQQALIITPLRISVDATQPSDHCENAMGAQTTYAILPTNRPTKHGRRTGFLNVLLVAVALHGLLGGILHLIPSTGNGSLSTKGLLVGLDTPREGHHPPFLVATLPVKIAPEASPRPSITISLHGDTPTPPKETIPPDVKEALKAEKERLLASLSQQRGQAAAIASQAASAQPPPPPRPKQGPVPLGTVRELDLTGQPQHVIDRVMGKYRMRIVDKFVSGKNSQSFLSSASTGGNDRYYATSAPRPGIYSVFEMSRESVAKMSILEEHEIRKRGLRPKTTKVSRVVFGIVPNTNGEPDLGIIAFESQNLD